MNNAATDTYDKVIHRGGHDPVSTAPVSGCLTTI